MNKIKVALICHVSNQSIRDRLKLHIPWYERVSRRLLKKNPPVLNDFAQWNTNAIRELSKIECLDLFVIAPAQFMNRKECSFCLENVRYCFFKDEDDYLFRKIQLVLSGKIDSSYSRNRKRIQRFIREIKPDIVHIIGAENPYYSLSALDIDGDIPLIVQLQTLMSDPNFLNNYTNSKAVYDFRANVEKAVIKRADYIATTVAAFRDIIVKDIKPSAKFLDMNFPLTEDVHAEETKKEFDFVYFASNISKACDLALEAFGIAHKSHPEITLDIIGNYTESFRIQIAEILEKYDITSFVSFEGKLASHGDVMRQIRKSRFALLPLKIDITSGTIRESMANGLPVLTTITQGTPELNRDYPCVLLSNIGDHQALADNMCKLIEDDSLAKMLICNGYKKASSKRSNSEIVADWVTEYKNILNFVL